MFQADDLEDELARLREKLAHAEGLNQGLEGQLAQHEALKQVCISCMMLCMVSCI